MHPDTKSIGLPQAICISVFKKISCLLNISGKAGVLGNIIYRPLMYELLQLSDRRRVNSFSQSIVVRLQSLSQVAYQLEERLSLNLPDRVNRLSRSLLGLAHLRLIHLGEYIFQLERRSDFVEVPGHVKLIGNAVGLILILLIPRAQILGSYSLYDSRPVLSQLIDEYDAGFEEQLKLVIDRLYHRQRHDLNAGVVRQAARSHVVTDRSVERAYGVELMALEQLLPDLNKCLVH